MKLKTSKIRLVRPKFVFLETFLLRLDSYSLGSVRKTSPNCHLAAVFRAPIPTCNISKGHSIQTAAVLYLEKYFTCVLEYTITTTTTTTTTTTKFKVLAF